MDPHRNFAATDPAAPFNEPTPTSNALPEDGGGDGRVAQAKDAATSAATETASTAADQAKQVASQAADQARTVAQEAKDQAAGLVDRARGELRGQVESRSHDAADTMRTWSDRLGALAEGRPEAAGPLAGYLDDARGRVTSWASQLDERGVEGMLGDVAGFARRRPGLFLLAAAGAGLVAGRLVRGARAANGAGSGAAAARQLPVAEPFDPYLPVPSALPLVEETAVVTGIRVP